MISVIIPTYNEENHIRSTVEQLQQLDTAALVAEIIVVDGGSTDKTVREASAAGALIISGDKGRARQMNAGTAVAKTNILYFLHADTLPPQNFSLDIMNAVDKNFVAGCYRLKFDHAHWFLNANSWFTRFDIDAIRFGDQSLFVTKEVFQQAGGFDESLIVMEDQEIIKRIRKHGKFIVMNGSTLTSARKYIDNGVYRMQGIFFLIYFMYQLGFPQHKLISTYRAFVRQDKV